MTTKKSNLAMNKFRTVSLAAVFVVGVVCVQVLLQRYQAQRVATAQTYRVGLVTDIGGVDDMSFNWFSYQGLLRAQDELGVPGTVYTSTTSDDYAPNLQQCADDGNDLCVSVGFPTADAISSTAAANPDTDFAIVDFSWETYPGTDNLQGMVFAADEVGYLAGTLAGLMTVSDTVGAVGGMEIPPVQAFVNGYRNGAQCANLDATVLISYTGTFGDEIVGAQAAQDMIAQEADVIFAAAGATGNGALLTATQSLVWAIGVDVDQYLTVFDDGAVAGSEYLLSSAMKRMDNAVFDTISDVVSGTFTSGTVLYDLEADGVGLAPFHEASVPVDVQTALQAVEGGIISGAIDINDDCRTYYVYVPLVLKNFGS